MQSDNLDTLQFEAQTVDDNTLFSSKKSKKRNPQPMMLNSFYPADFGARRISKRPSILVTRGRVRLNQAMVEKLKVTTGDRVVFHQNAERPEEWYITLDEKGFELVYPNKMQVKNLVFSNKKFVRMMLECYDAEKVEFNCEDLPIEYEGKKYWILKAV